MAASGLAAFGLAFAGLVSVSGCRVPPVSWASGPLSVKVASLNRCPVGAVASAMVHAAAHRVRGDALDRGPVDPVGRGGHHDVVDRTVRCLEPAALPHHVNLAGPVDLRGRQRRGPEVPGDQGGHGLHGEDRSAPGLSTIGGPDGSNDPSKPQVRMLSEMFPICSLRCQRVRRAPEVKRTLLIDVGGERSFRNCHLG